MNKLKEIRRLRELAEKYGLEDREILSKYPMNRLAQIYNGIGPDAFPEWLRGCVTALHPSLAAVAFIHDVEWHESDGTDETFKATNDRFKRNGYRVAEAEYGWWNPRRYAVMNQARRFGNYCQRFGKGRLAQVPRKAAQGRRGRVDDRPGLQRVRGGLHVCRI